MRLIPHMRTDNAQGTQPRRNRTNMSVPRLSLLVPRLIPQYGVRRTIGMYAQPTPKKMGILHSLDFSQTRPLPAQDFRAQSSINNLNVMKLSRCRTPERGCMSGRAQTAEHGMGRQRESTSGQQRSSLHRVVKGLQTRESMILKPTRGGFTPRSTTHDEP